MGTRYRAIAPQVTYRKCHCGYPTVWRYQHMNNTTNETAGNETAEDGNITAILDTVEESGMLDALMDDPLLAALAVLTPGPITLAWEVPLI